jgi:hypothetical protein
MFLSPQSTLLAILFAIQSSGAMAQGTVTVSVSFTEVRQGGPPPGAIQRTVQGSLQPGGKIADYETRIGPGRGGGSRGGGDVRGSNESVFGGQFGTARGGMATSEWRVGPNNTLIRRTRYRNDVETITVSLSGSASCRANVEFRLSGGSPMFLRAGRPYEHITAQNVTCSIQ